MDSRPVFLERMNNKGMGLIEWIIVLTIALLILAMKVR